MKAIGSIFIILILILAGVFWFVNRELIAFLEISLETANTDEIKAPDKDFDGWSFAVVGDLEGPTTITDKLLDQISQENIEFLVQLGDVVDANADVAKKQSNMEAMQEALEQLPVPVYHVPGNNDLIYDENLEIRTAALYQEVINPELYSTIEHNNARIFLLDNSYRRYGFPDEELTWLKQELATNSSPYTFLFFHRPIGVPGEDIFGDDETPFSREQNTKFRELLSGYSVNLILNGHLHTTLQYTLDQAPVIITGGGGGIPQAIFGGEDSAFYHYYLVHVPSDGYTPIDTQLVPLN